MQKDELAAARRSYQLRLNRLNRAQEKLTEAETALTQLFELTFKHPDAARAKFAELVQKRGLKHAVEKMTSKPSDVVPQWKALKGEHQIISGQSRERELARENLAKLAPYYRQAEEAQVNQLLAERLLATAQANLQLEQAAIPKLEPQPKRQKRRLRQRD